MSNSQHLKQLKAIEFFDMQKDLAVYTDHLKSKIKTASTSQKAGWEAKITLIERELLPNLKTLENTLIELDEMPLLEKRESLIHKTKKNKPVIFYRSIINPKREEKEQEFLQVMYNFTELIPRYKKVLSERHAHPSTTAFWKAIDTFLKFIRVLKKEDDHSTYGVKGAKIAKSIFSQFPPVDVDAKASKNVVVPPEHKTASKSHRR